MPELPSNPTKRQITAAVRSSSIVSGPGLAAINSTIYVPPVPPFLRMQGVYPIRNDSDQDFSRFEIVGLDGPIFDPAGGDAKLAAFKARIGFYTTHADPAAPDHYSHWGTLDSNVPAGGYGRVYVGIARPVQVNITSLNHYNAGVTGGDRSMLTSSSVAVARMLLPIAATGVMWQYVTLNGTFRSRKCSDT